MLSVIKLAYLLLPTLAGGSIAKQDPLCTDSYVEFESASVGSNVSGSNIRNQLYKVFYTPNQHLPYSVLVIYQLVLANGTRVNLSSDPDCSTQLWVWLSSPVFLYYDTTYFNRILLFTLNYFTELHPPHVSIVSATAPCPDEIEDFLSEMTASLQDYALGQMEHRTNLGYVKRGCGTSNYDTVFSPAGRRKGLELIFYVGVPIGVFCQFLFTWIVSGVLIKMAFKEYAQKTFTYSYEVYGMFWGISTTAVGLLGALCGTCGATALEYIAYKKAATTWPGIYVYLWLGALLFMMVVEFPVAIYTARKATVAVPGIFKYPATLLCCGRRRRAECFVTAIALWVNLVVLQLILIYGAIIVLAISAAPFAIASNVMVIVLALSCLVNIFSLLFAIFAHLCTPADQRVHSHSMVLRAVVLLPLLVMIICYGATITVVGSDTNMDAKKDNILSFINSFATPILLGLVVIFLKRFISAWLKWSPQEIENGTNNSQRQEADEELLDP